MLWESRDTREVWLLNIFRYINRENCYIFYLIAFLWSLRVAVKLIKRWELARIRTICVFYFQAWGIVARSRRPNEVKILFGRTGQIAREFYFFVQSYVRYVHWLVVASLLRLSSLRLLQNAIFNEQFCASWFQRYYGSTSNVNGNYLLQKSKPILLTSWIDPFTNFVPNDRSSLRTFLSCVAAFSCRCSSCEVSATCNSLDRDSSILPYYHAVANRSRGINR